MHFIGARLWRAESVEIQTLICIDLSNLAEWLFLFFLLKPCTECRAGGVTTIDQSDMRGLVTA
jgi:hypothetical protein